MYMCNTSNYYWEQDQNKVDHFKVKLRLPLVYHIGFSIKGEDEVDGDVDGDVDGEVDDDVDGQTFL